MATSKADAHLIAAVQAGQADAWATLIERYEGRLLSFARRRLADKAEAEDLVQDAFIGLLRSIDRYDAQRSLETYLFAILRNKLTDHFRKQRGGERQSLDALPVDDAPDAWLDPDTPSRHAARQEGLALQRGALVAALRLWVEHCRQHRRFQDLIVVEMLLVLGMRNKEVADDLSLSETGVAGIKFRVLEQWKKLTQAEAPEHAWQEADLAEDSTVGRIWRDEGISCLKRSTLGRYLLGVLDDEWREYVDFHVEVLTCDRCGANLDDLRAEDEKDDARDALRERVFASSVGFLSRRPDAGPPR